MCCLLQLHLNCCLQWSALRSNSAGLSFTRLQLSLDSGSNSYTWRNGMFLHDIFAFFWARCSSIGLRLWQTTHLFLTSKLSSTCGWTLFTVILFFCLLSFPVFWGINIPLTFSPSFYSGSVASLSRSFWTALTSLFMFCNPQALTAVLLCKSWVCLGITASNHFPEEILGWICWPESY